MDESRQFEGLTPQERVARGEHPVDVYHGGTYPMFMTPREIRDQFQGLDGDRRGWQPATRPNEKINAESDEELFARKLERARAPKPADEDAAARQGGAGVFDSISRKGFDTGRPITLSTGLGRNVPPPHNWLSGLGSQGRYQILGGHHRLAVMSELKPDTPVSVQWADSLLDRRGQRPM